MPYRPRARGLERLFGLDGLEVDDEPSDRNDLLLEPRIIAEPLERDLRVDDVHDTASLARVKLALVDFLRFGVFRCTAPALKHR
jgi:hypothetical protein